METAFLLQHERPDTEHVKTIGIYSTRAAAAAAIVRLCSQPGFSDYPGSFSIDEYTLDKDHWVDGFVDL